MKVVVVDYGSGNLRSAAKALELASAEISGQFEITVTGDAADVSKADYIILPGVGAFGDCIAGLVKLDGMIDVLNETVISGGRPFLGICVGMQLMADRGIEHGEHLGLGWIGGDVLPIEPVGEALKIPHMGWNELQVGTGDHPVLNAVSNGTHAYFVHSFSMRCLRPITAVGLSLEFAQEIAMPHSFTQKKARQWDLQFSKTFLSGGHDQIFLDRVALR